MKTISFWALASLLGAPAVLVKAEETQPTTTTSSETCTASLVTTLCDYPSPGPDFAVASGGRAFCWQYCNAHPPCNFVIFAAGNPYTGTGTCWLYPGQTFDASKGSSTCGNPYLSVYSKPVCSGGNPDTTTSGACAATASPSAVASVCGYAPPGDCFETCVASGGASDCLSSCAKAASCSYAVFNPHNPDNSPYASGTCWIYSNGTYDPKSATACSGAPEQFVYKNPCPKPSPSLSPSHSPSNSPSNSPSDSPSQSPSQSPSGTERAIGTQTADSAQAATTSSKNAAPASLSVSHPLAIGVAALLWQGL